MSCVVGRCHLQKVVTVYLDSHAYMGDRWLKGTHADMHGSVEEHLGEYLSDGWRVVSLFGFGGTENINARGWLAAVLEKT